MDSRVTRGEADIADVARSAAVVLTFTEPPETPALTARAAIFIVIAVGLLGVVVFALTDAVS